MSIHKKLTIMWWIIVLLIILTFVIGVFNGELGSYLLYFTMSSIVLGLIITTYIDIKGN